MKLLKKSTLSLAMTAAMFAGGFGSSAVVNAAAQSSMTDTTGDILLFPYYTVDNGFRTLLHLVNTSEQDTTIVKIRLRDYKNSDDVLDFTVILSPSDVFAGTISQGSDGNVRFRNSDDTTCTSPNVGALGSFMPANTIATGNTGHIEVITMATIDKDIATSRTGGAGSAFNYPDLANLVTRSTHDSAGNNSTADCDAVDRYFAKVGSGGDNIEALQTDLQAYLDDNADETIRSNLFGHYTVVDFANGIQGGGRPSTLSGMLEDTGPTRTHVSACDETGATNNTNVCGQFPEHFEYPHLAHVPGVDTTLAGVAATNVLAFQAAYHANTAGNLASSFVANEWTKNSSATSTVNSEWIVTLPTKYIYRDDYPMNTVQDGGSDMTSKRVFEGTTYPATTGEGGIWNDVSEVMFNNNDPIWDANGCSDYDNGMFDREEQDGPNQTSGTSTSGGQVNQEDPTKYCPEVGVLVFNSDLDYDGVTQPLDGGPTFRINTNPLSQNFGWGGFGITDASGADVTLPIIGYSMWNRDFGSAGTNYGHIMDHVK